jgi:hypothetical protein
VNASAALRWSPVAVAAAALAAFVWKLVPPLVNSDSAAVVLLADELVKSGRWLSPDWYYVSDSLMLDGSVHAAKVGVLLFGANVDAARFTIVVGIVLALLAGAWLGRVLSVRPSHALFAMCAFLLGPSLIYQDLMLGLPVTFQVALVMALLACAIRFALQKGAAWQLVLAGSLVALMSASTPKKALVYMLVPVIGGVVSQWFPSRDRDGSATNDHRRLWALLAVSACAWGAGSWLHALFKQGLVVNTSYARMSLVPEPAHILHNLGTVGMLAWRFAGGAGGVLATIAAALAAACWAWLVFAPVAMRKPWQALRGERGFAYGFAMGGTLAIGAYLLLYEQVRLYYGIYYALIPVSPLFVLAAARASDVAGSKVQAWGARGALALLLAFGIAATAMACVKFPADYFGFSKKQTSTSAERMQAMEWLEANGYQRGFGDYWDANSMTLVSGGRMRVGWLHVSPLKGRTYRQAWLSSPDRVNFVPGNEKWFIALNHRRRAQKPIADCLPADRVVNVASYHIYLYRTPKPGCLPPPVKPRRGS